MRIVVGTAEGFVKITRITRDDHGLKASLIAQRFEQFAVIATNAFSVFGGFFCHGAFVFHDFARQFFL